MVGDRNTYPPGGVCTTCWDTFTKTITLSAAWEDYVVGWDELRQQGWGVPESAALDTQQMIHINFQHPAGEAWEIWVDDVAFAHPKTSMDADAGGDGGGSALDAGAGNGSTPTVTGTSGVVTGGGCGCRICARSHPSGALAAFAGLLLFAFRRRRR
jgi:MYXO-CTERM domain-containing protein